MRISIKNKIRQILKSGEVVFVGIGNTIRGDDGVGPYVISKFVQRTVSYEFIDAGEMPENYIGKITKLKPKTVIIIDALDFDGKPGQIKILTPDKIQDITFSTHGMSLGLFTERIKQLSGAEVLFIGIKPYYVGLKEGLTDIIKAEADALIKMIGESICMN